MSLPFAPVCAPLSLDRLLIAADQSLRTVFGVHHAARAYPRPSEDETSLPRLSPEQRKESAALMRINHVGEVCAQALYTAQALVTRDDALRQHFDAAARDENDHLAWTETRLQELGDRTSLLNPLWYAGAFAIGVVAGTVGGDPVSLGFVVETERQVESHLQSHLDRLGQDDPASQAVIRQMQEDEARHAEAALAQGGVALPTPVKGLMRLASKVMTTTARHL